MMRLLGLLLPLACDPDPPPPPATPPSAPEGPPPPPGVILISVDTLRADQLAAWGGDPAITPEINAFAAEAARFVRAYAPSNETLFSHGALFTSRMPSDIGPVTYDFTLPREAETLAGAMEAHGWQAGASVASGHLARVFGLDVGFGDYIESEWWGSFAQTGPVALRWLDRRIEAGEPYLLFVHGYDCHSPYTKPGPLGRLATPGYDGPLLGALDDHILLEQIYRDRLFRDELPERTRTTQGQAVLSTDLHRRLPARYEAGEGTPLAPEDLDFVRGLYRTAVRYADMQVGTFLEGLEARGVLETATVILVSDHGEGLFSYGHLTHRTSLRDDATHVPLLVRPPGGLPGGGQTIEAVVSLLDVAPTALAAAGAPIPAAMQGSDLSACIREPDRCPADGIALSEGVMQLVSARDARHRLVVEGLDPHDPRLPAALRDPALPGLALSLYDDADRPAEDPQATARLLDALRADHPPPAEPSP